jgi:cyclopropane-fatty-acyl-phospholipid synthase
MRLRRPRPSEPDETKRAASAPLSALERRLLRRGLDALGHPPFTFVLWNGEQVPGSDEPSRGRVHLRDRALLREILRSPDLAFGEGYSDGRIEFEGDVTAFVTLAFQASARSAAWARPLSRALTWRPRLGTRWNARRNVHHHYDLGNDFYALWLDERMVYTCAYFGKPEASLEEAQLAKLDHVCRKLRLRPGEQVVEAGCGWGALALHMAEHHGVTVRAFNISTEQIRWAREQASRRGLASRVEFVDDDYRCISGRFDAFVSVGMLEHVARAHYRTLGRLIDRCLAPHGRGLLHFIGHTRRIPTSPWLDRYIFPGGYMPALSEMLPVLEPRSFEVADVENLRRHYVRTLEHWLERFEKAAERIAGRYDERFVRMWRLYLACSIAAFRTGSIQLYQLLFARAGDTRLPWTRDDLYTGG